MDVDFRRDKAEAISVIREAARWPIDTNKPMWSIDSITEEAFFYIPEENCIVEYVGGRSAAALLLIAPRDLDKLIWKGCPSAEAAYIQKLSVRREFAGQGYAERLIEHAVEICKNKNIALLRLECDPEREGLMRLYRKCGFELAGIKTLETKKLGKISFAQFEMKLNGN